MLPQFCLTPHQAKQFGLGEKKAAEQGLAQTGKSLTAKRPEPAPKRSWEVEAEPGRKLIGDSPVTGLHGIFLCTSGNSFVTSMELGVP